MDKEINYKRETLLGILVGSSILIKHTTGTIFSLIFVFYKILNIYERKKWKETLKILLFRGIGVILPILIFCIYLAVNNIWNEFIDYTILGIKTFSSQVSYINLLNGNYGKIIQVLSIVMPLLLIYMYIKTIAMRISTKEHKILLILFVYSVASLVVVYPIADDIHFLIGVLPLQIALIYLIWRKIEYINNINYKLFLQYFIQVFTLISLTLIIAISAINLYQYFIKMKEYTSLQNFKYMIIDEKHIQEIDEFIINKEAEGKQVYILDATAAAYMIPLNKYNKDFDMFMKGNLGADGEEGEIKKLERSKSNTILLILSNNYSRNWQNPEKVRDYIVGNWEKTGSINVFDIYEKEKNI